MTTHLTPLDAAFLELEQVDESAHMHIGWAMIFDPPPEGGAPSLGCPANQTVERLEPRVTRYEGAAPDAIDENLHKKKDVLPTEFGQTEGMRGVVFLTDRKTGSIVVISLWDGRGRDAGE